MAGDYILSVASTMLARIRNEEVIVVLSQVSQCLESGRVVWSAAGLMCGSLISVWW